MTKDDSTTLTIKNLKSYVEGEAENDILELALNVKMSPEYIKTLIDYFRDPQNTEEVEVLSNLLREVLGLEPSDNQTPETTH